MKPQIIVNVSQYQRHKMDTSENETEERKKPNPWVILAFVIAPPLIYYITGVIHPWMALLGIIIVPIHFIIAVVLWAVTYQEKRTGYQIYFAVMALILSLTLWKFVTISHYGVRDYFRLQLSQTELHEIVQTYEKQLKVQFSSSSREGETIPLKWHYKSNSSMESHLLEKTALSQLGGFDTFVGSPYGFSYSIKNKDSYPMFDFFD